MKFLKVKRLRKKAGSILFIVIIVMAMLIALATGAYYTAFTARLSIVDNYNYSQLYLSATSISDMAISALVNTQTDVTYNNFATFTNAVQDIVSVGQTVSASSSTNTDAIPGMVDNYRIDVTLEKQKYVPLGQPDGSVKLWEDRYYKIDALAGYADDTVEIETLLYCQVEYVNSSNPGDRILVPDYEERVITEPGDAPNFDSFFITTGQNDQHQVVKISVNKITDDAYFKNDVTYFSYNQNQRANNTFYKNLTSTGSICFDGKFSIDTSVQSDKEWYIGEDLLLMNDNASRMNLGNDGVLYVGGDLVVGNQQGIKAKYIYVLGDLYLVSPQSTLDCEGLYVAGNIYTSYDGSAYSNSNGPFGTLTPGNTNPYNFGSNTNIYINGDASQAINGNKINGGLISGGWDTTVASDTLDAQMDTQNYSNYVTGAQIDVSSRTFEIDLGITWNGTTNQWEPNANSPYYNVEVNGNDINITITAGNCTIDNIIGAGTNESYFNYNFLFDIESADTSTLEELVLKDDDGNPTGETGHAAYVCLNPNCVISGSGNSATFTDGGSANTGFTWLGVGNGSNSNGSFTTVLANGQKNDAVVFEMGSYDINGDGSADGITTYFQRQKNYVGSQSVFDALGGNVFQNGAFGTLLDSNSELLDPNNVFNNILLISTSDQSNGMQIESTDSNFSGYAYAPYMNYTSTGENNTGTAIFGGLIVNAYDIGGQRDYTYVVPNNPVLEQVFAGMQQDGPGGSRTELVLVGHHWEISTGSSTSPTPSNYKYSQGASNYIG